MREAHANLFGLEVATAGMGGGRIEVETSNNNVTDAGNIALQNTAPVRGNSQYSDYGFTDTSTSDDEGEPLDNLQVRVYPEDDAHGAAGKDGSVERTAVIKAKETMLTAEERVNAFLNRGVVEGGRSGEGGELDDTGVDRVADVFTGLFEQPGEEFGFDHDADGVE